MSDYFVYIGTYSNGGSEGVYVQRLDMESGTLSPISAHGEIENPSFLDLSPDRQFLYAIGEVCLLYTSPSPRDRTRSRMPSSA